MRRLDVVDHHEGRHLAGLDLADHVALADQRDRGGAAEHRIDRLAAALERHAHPVGALLLLELLHVERERRRRREVAQGVGLRLGIRDQLVHGLDVEIGVDHERLDKMEQVRDRLHALLGIERHVLEQPLVIDQRIGIDDADRVAVRRRLAARARADVLHAARPVLDHDRLAQALAQLFPERAHEDVADPARAGGREHADRPAGIVLRRQPA